MSKQRVGLFGGTFDPVHLGHLIAASRFLEELSLDEVWFLPAGAPPHKPAKPIPPAADRARMIQLAIAGREDLRLSLLDADDGTPSYTVELLRALVASRPDLQFTFLMGSDSLIDLPNWREPGSIVELAEVGVALRPGSTADKIGISAKIGADSSRIHLVPMPMIGISSTDIRDRVRQGKTIAFMVPLPVERYIEANRLYRDTDVS